jgi:hypothetical protein
MPAERPGAALETTLSLREYFEHRLVEMDRLYMTMFQGQKEATALAMSNAEKALIKSDEAYTRKLESLNELRGVVTDQQQEFAKKSEIGLMLDNLQERCETNHSLIMSLQARSAGMGSLVGYIIGAAGVAAAIVALFKGH